MLFNLEFRIAIEHHPLNIPYIFIFYNTFKGGFHEVFFEIWFSCDNLSWKSSFGAKQMKTMQKRWFEVSQKSQKKKRYVKRVMLYQGHTLEIRALCEFKIYTHVYKANNINIFY